MSSTPPDDPTPGPWQPDETTPPATPPPSAPAPGQWPPAGSPPPAAPPPGGPPPGQWPPRPTPPAGPPPGGQPPGYSPGVFAPGAYGAPGSGYPTAPSGYGYGGAYRAPINHPQGTTILVLGILSLVCCGLLGPVAWIMGNTAIRQIDANPAAYSNRGSVQAGRILGIIASALLVLGILGWIALFALGSSSSSSGY